MSTRKAPSGVCQCCGQWVEYLELDHIIPKFEGGLNDTSNLQWLCYGETKIKMSIAQIKRYSKVA